MKTEMLDYSSESSGALSSSPMGFSEDGITFIQEILRKSIYSNPILATVKEVSCNGFDSHVCSGIKERPIEVTLPSFEKPEFIVRDFGYGLNYHDLCYVFGSYGASTKRNSNELIGQLGIGSKSPFSYCDSYSVISRHQGTKNIYSLVINSDGRGEVLLLSSSPTVEESGLEVIVPVECKDIDNFIETSLNLFSYWDVKPILHNCFKSYPQRNYKVKGTKYSRLEGKEPTRVIMGNIPYAVHLDQLPDLTSGQRAAFNYGWEFYVNIGEVDFSANRETLRGTPKTINVLTDLIVRAMEDYKNQLQQEFDNCANLREAKILLKKMKDECLFYRYCNSQVKYKGMEIDGATFKIKYRNDYVGIYKNRGSLKSILRHTVDELSAETKNIYYWVSGTKHLRKRLDEIPLDAPVIKAESQSDVVEFIKNNNLEDFPLIDIGMFDIIIPKRSSGNSYRSGESDLRYKAQIFQYSCDREISDDKYAVDKDFWRIVDTMPKKGVYIVLDKFTAYKGVSEDIQTLKKFEPDTVIYGVKVAAVGKLNKRWIGLHNYVKNRLREIVTPIIKNKRKASAFFYKDQIEFLQENSISSSDLKPGLVKKIAKIVESVYKDKRMSLIDDALRVYACGRPELTEDIQETIHKLGKEIAILNQLVLNNSSFKHRFSEEARKNFIIKALT